MGPNSGLDGAHVGLKEPAPKFLDKGSKAIRNRKKFEIDIQQTKLTTKVKHDISPKLHEQFEKHGTY